ncbi:hypothetical protein DFH06DRAFT_576910 [Mycena polygramma]|nr:hypothetical protein DFH06DRAFT_576910 [Mycena polygramma]
MYHPLPLPEPHAPPRISVRPPASSTARSLDRPADAMRHDARRNRLLDLQYGPCPHAEARRAVMPSLQRPSARRSSAEQTRGHLSPSSSWLERARVNPHVHGTHRRDTVAASACSTYLPHPQRALDPSAHPLDPSSLRMSTQRSRQIGPAPAPRFEDGWHRAFPHYRHLSQPRRSSIGTHSAGRSFSSLRADQSSSRLRPSHVARPTLGANTKQRLPESAGRRSSVWRSQRCRLAQPGGTHGNSECAFVRQSLTRCIFPDRTQRSSTSALSCLLPPSPALAPPRLPKSPLLLACTQIGTTASTQRWHLPSRDAVCGAHRLGACSDSTTKAQVQVIVIVHRAPMRSSKSALRYPESPRQQRSTSASSGLPPTPSSTPGPPRPITPAQTSAPPADSKTGSTASHVAPAPSRVSEAVQRSAHILRARCRSAAGW